MSKTFDQIVTAVSEDIQDTTAEMKSIIGRYVNNRYRKVLRATNFKVINNDYTVTVVAGTAEYTLPEDFGKELYCNDSTNKKNLERIDLARLGKDMDSSLLETGAVEYYSIFRNDSDSIILRLHRIPTEAITILLPYTVKIRANLTSADVPVNDFADLLEIGATGDSWRYKRQFAKARSYDVMFDEELDMYMFDAENQEAGENKFTITSSDYDRSYVG